MREAITARPSQRLRRTAAIAMAVGLFTIGTTANAAATEQVYFSAVDNVTDVLVQHINAETVRLDISSWYLSEHSISIAIANRFAAGVPVRLMGDRGAIFEADAHTRAEFYWLASQGVPIRLRFNPTWFPEINHWKMAIFVGQNMVEFGSGNFAPTELAPVSSTNYDDETELFTDDPVLVNAFKTKFDVMWNDTTREPESLVANPPYFKDWNDACANEPTGKCADYHTLYPNPAPMIVNTARLEGDNPTPPDLIWGQGPDFNNRLTQEIYNENSRIDLIIYRLEVDNITEALLAKFRAGVPVRLIVDPGQYTNIIWPEYWLTHANVEKLWVAGVPIRQALHAGVTHMKTLVTSTYATNGSSNFGPNWQRDHDYFVPSATKPAIYQAIANRVDTMWNDTVGFGPLRLTPPKAADLASPASGATGVASSTSLVWNIAAWAVSYDVYLGTTQSNMTLVGNVPAQLVTNPPSTYSWTPATALQVGTTYFWKVVSRTNATALVPSMIATSATWSFTTAGSAGPPAAPTAPTPSDGATGVGTAPTLGWAAGAIGTTYTIAFGTTNPPPQVASGLSSASYAPGTLAANTTYYWGVTAVSSGGGTAGATWSFQTGTGGGGVASEVVIYASDVAQADIHGTWSQIADATAAAGIKLSNPDAGVAALAAPLANPTNYFDASFQAVAGTRYRVWLRIHAIGDSKWNDSVFVQFSDSTDVSGNAIYRMGTTGGLLVNLAIDSTGTSDQGWGWQRNAYWLSDTGDVWFQNSGPHTIRVQVREDGAEIDQIVISPVTYATNPPGPATRDNTIVPKPAAQPPSAPGLPAPPNGASGVDPDVTLTWKASGATSYDVNFGTSNPPPLVSTGMSSASYATGTLNNGTTYFWQVVAHNTGGATTGAVWSFVTAAAAPPPPGTPASPSPASGATGVGVSAALTWAATGATSYDVSFGTTNPPPQVTAGQTAPSLAPGSLSNGTTYFWQVVAHNGGGATSGPVWSFTTVAAPPSTPGAPSPTNGATGVGTTPTLTWSATGATSYDVNFGTSNPPPQVSAGQTAASLAPGSLSNGTTYFWQVVAHNGGGATSGPVWSYTTAVTPPPPPPPSTPGSPSPTDGATGVSTAPTLAWSSTGATTYDVSFGTSNPPPQVLAGQTTASYAPTGLSNSTTYFWQIVSHNTAGTTSGPVWSFTTAAPLANAEIVIYAGDIPSGNLHGMWSAGADPTSPNGVKLVTPDNGWATTTNPTAAPTDYVDVTFDANAGVPYTLWLRIQALNNSKYNDSVWVQFSDAMANGASIYPMNTTSGLDVNLATDSAATSLNHWGWQNTAYWLSQPTTVTFATSGAHTMRIQVREDGVQFDQIVLSSSRYLTTAPGGVTNDATIVSKP
jgi:hypothetical protein